MPIIEGVIIPQDVQMSLVDEGILFGKRLWKNSEGFHSLSYLRRKTSNSYTVSFSYQNKEKYGSVLFFTSYGHVVVKLFQITGQKLYTEDSLDATRMVLFKMRYILSIFNYCCIIWMFCSKKCNNSIDKAHKGHYEQSIKIGTDL